MSRSCSTWSLYRMVNPASPFKLRVYTMSSPNPTSVEEGKETSNSDPSEVSNDRSSAEKKKVKKRPRDQPQVATEAKGEVDSQSVDEPEATEGTTSSAPPPSKRWTKNSINHLQAENERLKQALRGPSESVKRISWRTTNPLRRRRMVVALSVSTTTTQIPGCSTTMSTPKMTRSPWRTVDWSKGRGLHQHLALVCWVSPTTGWSTST